MGEVTEDPQEVDHRTINRVVYIDGKPVGKDEVIIDPETSDHTVKQRNIARKLIYIEGKPSSSSVDRTTSEWEKREIDSNGGKHFSTSSSTAMSAATYIPSYSSATTSLPTVTLTTTPSLSTSITTTAMSWPGSVGERQTTVISDLSDTSQPIRSTSRSQRVIKKMIYVDGRPLEIEKLEEVTDEPDSVDVDMSTMSHLNLITRRKFIKKIVMMNGVPTETEEEIVEPDIEEPYTSHTHLITRRKIIKKIVMINGVPTETEEEIIEPDVSGQTSFIERRVIKKVVMINGVPTETEEEIEVPKFEGDQNVIESITRKRTIKRIMMIDGVPTETEQENEEPESKYQRII